MIVRTALRNGKFNDCIKLYNIKALITSSIQLNGRIVNVISLLLIFPHSIVFCYLKKRV